jgi:hypothetical protein
LRHPVDHGHVRVLAHDVLLSWAALTLDRTLRSRGTATHREDDGSRPRRHRSFCGVGVLATGRKLVSSAAD